MVEGNSFKYFTTCQQKLKREVTFSKFVCCRICLLTALYYDKYWLLVSLSLGHKNICQLIDREECNVCHIALFILLSTN